MGSNYGYVFRNMFDLFCYTIISVLYPALTFGVQLCQINMEDGHSIANALLTACFFCLTFFYDFYSRYRDCAPQTEYVVNVLRIGRAIFFLLVLMVIVAIILVLFNVITGFVKIAVVLCGSLAVYPFGMAMIEWNKMLKEEKESKVYKEQPKRKISDKFV